MRPGRAPSSRRRALVEAGADMNLADPEGTSALLLAIINGHYDVGGDADREGRRSQRRRRDGRAALYAVTEMNTLVHPREARPEEDQHAGPMDVASCCWPTVRTRIRR